MKTPDKLFGNYAVINLSPYTRPCAWCVYNFETERIEVMYPTETEATVAAFSLKIMDELEGARLAKGDEK